VRRSALALTRGGEKETTVEMESELPTEQVFILSTREEKHRGPSSENVGTVGGETAEELLPRAKTGLLLLLLLLTAILHGIDCSSSCPEARINDPRFPPWRCFRFLVVYFVDLQKNSRALAPRGANIMEMNPPPPHQHTHTHTIAGCDSDLRFKCFTSTSRGAVSCVFAALWEASRWSPGRRSPLRRLRPVLI